MGSCPFHVEDTPSFFVSPKSRVYHCFGCGAHGDVISFIQKYNDINFIESLEYINSKYGIPIDSFKCDDKEKVRKRDVILKLNNTAMSFFYKSLKKNKEAIAYLKNRKISGRSAQKYQIGYAPRTDDKLFKYFISKGFSEEDIIDDSLASKKNGR